MQDERAHMIKHRLASIAEGRWTQPGMARDLAELGISADMLLRIQRQAQELLAVWDARLNPVMKE